MSPNVLSTIGPKPILGALLLLLGVGLAGFGAYDYTQQSGTIDDAVTVNATISETDVETVTSKGSQSYAPTVGFDYRYQGTTYTSDRVFPTASRPKYDTRSKAAAVVRAYEPGETVTAHVDPAEPGNAFLEARRSDHPLKFAGIGAFIVVATLASFAKSSLGL
ncbi:DUF3592 domain-containing protein [Haloarculaceae archaeon H-GB11]|nr:DUF3592 domain-containing protein [Haloarculaceae archaeon H-GB11]